MVKLLYENRSTIFAGMDSEEPKKEELRKTASDAPIDWRNYRSPQKRSTDSVETCIECDTKGILSCSKHGRK
jgi:hypothetical protein